MKNAVVDTPHWIAADKEHCWHPFTRQAEWEASDPLVLVSGEGVWLEDSEGKKYIDGNASIWTNIHGHNHPVINQAITEQLEKVAHTSYLGFANPRASELAERLVGFFSETDLQRVFFSDDGSTAVECAVKMAVQYRMQVDDPGRTHFIAFDRSYHGDTAGAASLGGVGAFVERFRKFGYPVTHVADLEALYALDVSVVSQTAAIIIEPLVQGVNEIHVWPNGMLRELRQWCDTHHVHLILDEVMTGFGRTGTMFACQQEQVVPDFLCLAKGLTGGYMPLAATMVTESIYEAFSGTGDKAFYYGHSYTANQLGCAAALANLRVFEQEETLAHLPEKISMLRHRLAELAGRYEQIYEVRQCGMIAGVELREASGEKFSPECRVGEAVSLVARDYGLLTRPILDTLVIMPPLFICLAEIEQMCDALDHALGSFLDH